MKTIYLISASFNNDILYKIGYTKRPVNERIKDFKTGNCSKFNIIKEYKCDKNWTKIEKALHRKFNSKKIKGEWFSLDDEDIDNFIENCKLYQKSFDFLSKWNIFI